MSWISPTFSGDDAFVPPPKKKTKAKTSKSEKSCNGFEPPSCNWLEKHKPKDVSDLLVHDKKVKEIECWVKQALKADSSEKVLLITGPSGSGKSVTLQIICKSSGIKVLEWITPLDKPSDDSSEFPLKFEFLKSAAKQFEEYVFKSSRYNSCLVSSVPKKLILVKDFPNVFVHNPSSFHDILERFSQFCINPIVFICSDESLCRKLFPNSVKDKIKLHTVTFNPITDQKMVKFLKILIAQEGKFNKNMKVLPDEAIHAICAASQGDLRGAVSKLHFCSINSDYDISQLKIRGNGKRKISDINIETDKDKRLDFFRGMGRVLYPKKLETDQGMKFVHSTTEIVGNFLSEPKSFINQLHENYPTKIGNVQDLMDASERMSKSDILMTRWQEKDVFSEYSLAVAIQGVMVSNKNPVKSKFEAFRKSQTSRLEIDTKALELEGKAVFSDLCILDYGSLIDILPYSKFLLPSLNPAQLDYITKTCYFK